MAFVSLFYLHPDFYTAERARQADRIAGAAQVSVVVTSLTASFTICYHIYTSTSRDTRSRRRYMHIVELLVQSSFVYTVMQTVLIVDYFMGTGTLGDNKIILFILGDYFNALANIASVSHMPYWNLTKSSDDDVFSLSSGPRSHTHGRQNNIFIIKSWEHKGLGVIS